MEPCFKNDISVNYSITIVPPLMSGMDGVNDVRKLYRTFLSTDTSIELFNLLPFRELHVSVAPVNSFATGLGQSLDFRTKVSGTALK